MNCVFGDVPFLALNGKRQGKHKVVFTKPTMLAVAFLATVGSAFAQPRFGPSNYDVKNMSFDTWCRETAHSADRCRARWPEDVKAFEDYRAVIERYELEHLKRVQQNEEFRADINRDLSQTVRNLPDGLPYPDFSSFKERVVRSVSGMTDIAPPSCSMEFSPWTMK